MADIDLPLWSIPPNWKGGVTERLSWLTNILGPKTGAEQRIALRLSPRREFQFTVNPIGRVRSFLDQWLHRITDERCLLPLWHDKNHLAETAGLGDTRVEFATEYTEFLEGGLAVLWADAFTYEVVELTSIDADGIDFATPLTKVWPKGSIVYPLRRVWIDPAVRFTALTSRVGDAAVSFLVDGTNDYDPGDEVLEEYAGHPVVTLEPNRRDDLETQFERDMETFDSETGLVRRYDEIGRAFQTQFYNWTAYGRQQHHQLRQTLYRLKGRQKAFWMPSFNEDVTVARPLSPGQNALDIQRIGYAMLGGAVEGRDRLFLRDDTGTARFVRIINYGVPLSGQEDRLVLSEGSTFNVAAGRTGSFLSIMRLENDAIEINHHTDTHGVCEVGVACKSFSDTRDAVGPFIWTRPEAEMVEGFCGDPPNPYLYFRWEFPPGPTGALQGNPALGFFVKPEHLSVGLRGPDEFYCHAYAQWKFAIPEGENLDLPGYVWGQRQGNSASCTRTGDWVAGHRLLVRKPGWTVWRALMDDPRNDILGYYNEWWVRPNGVGIGASEASGFPIRTFWHLPGDEETGYADYTIPFEEPDE